MDIITFSLMYGLVETIDRNQFVKKLYPNGVKSLALVGVRTDLSTAHIYVRTNDSPEIEIEKYGQWGTDYDAIEFYLIGEFMTRMRSECVNQNLKDDCSFSLNIKEESLEMKFWRTSIWSLDLSVKSLVFQSCKAYIKSDYDYNPR